jgi:phage gp36-like protein
MPRYLEIAELKSFRGEAEINRLAGGSDTTLVAAIQQAEGEATSYLLSRYRQTLPTVPGAAPGVLKAKVAVIAHRKLITGGQLAPALQAEYDQALTWLRDVSRGAAALDLDTAPPVDNGSPTILSNASPFEPPGMRLEDLERW